MADIPQPDAQFDAMWTAFMAYATPNLANLGLGLGDPEWTNLLAAKTDWDTKYPAHITAQANAESARAGKDVSRATGEALLRALIIILRANTTDVSAAELEALGLSLYDTTRTPSPVPTTRPVLQVDTSQRLGRRDHADLAPKARRRARSGAIRQDRRRCAHGDRRMRVRDAGHEDAVPIRV